MITLTLFGEFSMKAREVTLREDDIRSPRVFRALLYLVANRNRRVSLKDFSAFLREGKDYTAPAAYSAGSDSLVKTTLHRIRTLLAPLTAEEPACVLHCRDGGIWFDPALVFTSDTDRFSEISSQLSQKTDGVSLWEKNPDRALFLFHTLTTLYCGRYLQALQNEGYGLTLSQKYHETYTALCEECLPHLFHEGLYDDVIDIASRGSAIDPYFEGFHYWKLRSIAEKGDKTTALALYEGVERLFFNRFHINPSARMRKFRETLTLSPVAESADTVLDTLRAMGKAFLSPEAFGTLLSLGETSGYTFLLLTLEDEQDTLTLPFDGLICTQYSTSQFAFLLRDGNEEKYLLNALVKTGIPHRAQSLPLSPKIMEKSE